MDEYLRYPFRVPQFFCIMYFVQKRPFKFVSTAVYKLNNIWYNLYIMLILAIKISPE